MKEDKRNDRLAASAGAAGAVGLSGAYYKAARDNAIIGGYRKASSAQKNKLNRQYKYSKQNHPDYIREQQAKARQGMEDWKIEQSKKHKVIDRSPYKGSTDRSKKPSPERGEYVSDSKGNPIRNPDKTLKSKRHILSGALRRFWPRASLPKGLIFRNPYR